MNRFLAATGLLVFALFVGGCGGDNLASLTGKVTIDGKPAPEGLALQFTPTSPDGSASYASTNAEGEYEAAFTFRKKGIQPGEHLVKLVPGNVKTPMPKIGPDGKPESVPDNPVSKLPREYYEKIKMVTIEPGENAIDFPLSTEKK